MTVLLGSLWIGRRVVTPHAGPPILPSVETSFQNRRANAQVVVGIECLPGGTEPVLVVTPIHLHQADIDGTPAILEPLHQRSHYCHAA